VATQANVNDANVDIASVPSPKTSSSKEEIMKQTIEVAGVTEEQINEPEKRKAVEKKIAKYIGVENDKVQIKDVKPSSSPEAHDGVDIQYEVIAQDTPRENEVMITKMKDMATAAAVPHSPASDIVKEVATQANVDEANVHIASTPTPKMKQTIGIAGVTEEQINEPEKRKAVEKKIAKYIGVENDKVQIKDLKTSSSGGDGVNIQYEVEEEEEKPGSATNKEDNNKNNKNKNNKNDNNNNNGGSGRSTSTFRLDSSPLEQRAAAAANKQAILATHSPRHTLRAKSQRAERAFQALQRQVHAARAQKALEENDETHEQYQDMLHYAAHSKKIADEEVENVRTTIMMSFLQLEGGGCSAQKTAGQCQSMLDLWDATDGTDGNVCSFCTLPREYGGPQYECLECDSVFEPEKRHWDCTVTYKQCQSKKPTPPTPPVSPKDPGPKEDYYDSADDNPMSEQIVKGVLTAGVSELANKLHFNLVKNLRQDVNASVVRGVSRTLTHQLIKDLTLELTTQLVQTLTQTLTRVTTREVTRHVTPTLTSSLSSTLTQALTRSPKDDYYCALCQKHKLYCTLCYTATKKMTENSYYSNYYGNYFSNYYSYYYGTVYADRFAVDSFSRGIHAPNKPKWQKEGGARVDGIAYPVGTT
jgi:hypothetical protein